MEIKPKLLCLHGYRQNAQLLKEKLGAFRKLLKNNAEFYFVDAPHVINNSDGYKNNNERSWWFTNENNTFDSSQISNICIGLEESIAKISNICETTGPFTGLLGFSQGAAFATILCAIMGKNFKFVILIAGFKSSVIEHSTYYNNLIKIPSLHVMGESDAVIAKKKSEELYNCFEVKTAEVTIHEGGHYVPANKNLKDAYVSFITKYS